MTTTMGYAVSNLHPMASSGYKYRFISVSGILHVDEYVAPVGVWVYLGSVR